MNQPKETNPALFIVIACLLAVLSVWMFFAGKTAGAIEHEHQTEQQVKALQDSLNIYKADAQTLKLKLIILENERITNIGAFNRFNERFGKRSGQPTN
jgi:regulatory protein YycI of two-component signal transduction system YycFG